MYLKLNKFFNSFRNIIFDYDNTLALIPINWQLERKNFNCFCKKNFQISFNGLRIDEMESKLFNLYPNRNSEILKFRRCLEIQYLGKHLPHEILVNSIRNIDSNLFIVSNNLCETVTSGLSSFKVLENFTRIIGVDTLCSPKPSTLSWDYLVKHHNLNSYDTLYVGDSPATDGIYSSKIGIPFLQLPVTNYPS
tara:strand:+ start:10108 stop:10686 length:579 start_codon:yes stop_codon:yes gene_type:complete